MPVDTPQAILENNQNLTDRIVGTYINRAIVFSNTMHALIFILKRHAIHNDITTVTQAVSGTLGRRA